MTEWLLLKRGLYYRPEDCGYTGIRDHAGRYTEEHAVARCGNGVTAIRLESAPEFTDACFDDLAREHLTKQRDEARAALLSEREAISAEARRYADHYPPFSDGRNTFILLAEWIERRLSTGNGAK